MVRRAMMAGVLCGAVCAQQSPLAWTAAYELATAKLSEMSREEKNLLIKAYAPDADNAYVGNVPGVPRVGIPSLNMADAGQGFRVQKTEHIGTATSWPSGLAMGATWNPNLLMELGEALGSEFSGKGANVILGPGLEVQRVARDGRGFEYLSGDDPVLGAKLGAKYVEGVQSMGVMAVLKHFALHHQQENNKDESSYTDAKTNWELYYPPFEAAIEAGAVAVMSAYSNSTELGQLKMLICSGAI
jgi:beta-glucosidase